MTRRLVLLVAGLGLWAGAGAAPLRAQHVRFYIPDTALTILTGRTATAELWVQGGGGVSA
ncbi:MAG: hypothetical protein HYW06_09445, partial [Gemmatimonadetes bacterium]|nr:hypothetical protein [Gemmatimonadota bacterium]